MAKVKAYALNDENGDTYVIVIGDLELAKDIAYEFDFEQIEEVNLSDDVFN